VKSNIGHAQTAAGAAGVIKMVMALQHEVLPPTLHAAEPSPHIDWSAGTVRLLTGERDWPAGGDGPRRAGVSSFGISGTNAHLILEQPPAEELADGEATGEPAGLLADGVVPWVVSGQGGAGLRAQAARLAGFARAGCGGAGVADVGWSLASGRTAFQHRAVVLARDAAGYVASLNAVAASEPASGASQGRVPDGGPGKVAFVFPGQGGQWPGMAAGLADSCPAFAERLAECVAALQPQVDWPVAQALREAGEQAGPEIIQPLLWAVMVALAAAWESLGVTPDAVAGHSQGEIAAATVAGILPLNDAARMIAARGRALAGLPAGGGMAAVAWSAETAGQAIAGCAGTVWVAAVNSPSSVVLAGDRDELTSVLRRAEADGVRVRWLPVSYASHGPAVAAVAAEIEQELAGISARPGRVPFWSAVTGDLADSAALDCGYWAANLREQVQFEQVVRGLAGAGYGVFIEVSPHPVLVTAVEQTLADAGLDEAVAAGTLRRAEGGPARLLTAAAEVFVRGVHVDWAALFAGARSRRVPLPTYAFQRRRYWPELKPGQVGGNGAPAVGGDGAEAGFWAAVDRQDLAGLARTVGLADDAPLSAVLPALAGWRRRRQQELMVDRLRYQVSWVPVSGLPDDAGLNGRWLLIVPAALAEGELALACAGVLAEGGAQVITVAVGPAELDREVLAGTLRIAADGEVAGIVSLLALDEGEHAASVALSAGVAGTLVLVQALGDAGIEARQWTLTRGAVATGADSGPVRAVQAQVWGLGRVAALEQPKRWGGLIDLPDVIAGRTGGWLRAILAGETGADQVAIRATEVLARRLVRAPAVDAGRAGSWRPCGPVLVTGATGAIGPMLARWVARSGATRVVLASRRGMAAAGTAGLAARVCGSGSAVTVAACDVVDRPDLAALLSRLAAAGTAVRGVIHAAAVIKLDPLDRLSLPGLAEVCGAKVAGAANLDALLGGSVDAFVLFSSIAGVWGSGNHGAYAAANAYLDALAQDRRARGLAATSVPWGVWLPAQDGKDAGQESASFDYGPMIRQGLPFLPPGLAFTGLRQVLDGDEVCTAVAPVDWDRFAPVFTSGRPSPLLSGVPEAQQVIEADQAQPGQSPSRGQLAERLAGRSAADQERLVLGLVCEQAAAVLGHDSPDEVRPGAAFRDLGFDSVTAVELRNKLTLVTGLRLPATLVFDYPTPKALAAWLRAQASPGDTEVTVSVLAGLDQLDTALTAGEIDRGERTRITLRLEALLSKWKSQQRPGDEGAVTEKLQSSTPEEVMRFIDSELGLP
jgi:acyl transferase domain-containing protein/acyl carrier protein